MAEPVIVIDREVMSGTPCLRGTRVPFKNLIDYLEGGTPWVSSCASFLSHARNGRPGSGGSKGFIAR